MQPRSLEGAFCMAAFLAFLEIRSFKADHPSLDDTEAVTSLNRIRASATGLDYRGGLALLQTLDSSQDWVLSRDRLRLFVFEWIRLVKPSWVRLIPYGREKLRGALGDDQAQCFREAGLFDELPDDEIVKWWDRLAGLVRGDADAEKMNRARHAERLSLEYERSRLKNLGICEVPIWVALEDNSLGYDILSYDINSDGRVVRRMVEVKSKLSNTIFITRNEWENVSGADQQSVIHVWDIQQERLREYRAWDVAHHIPTDQGAGVWQNVCIALDPV